MGFHYYFDAIVALTHMIKGKAEPANYRIKKACWKLYAHFYLFNST